ncbi:hypothetical protein HNY73_000443 [Argiope bruennichi]|uniref:Uncharacterized protein n=1 Tax=Argiope bruennichi TaxID=94029 RepID=A0A8T0FY98_ARGBR|nr:hypothetical protein HNY73_000443 [Argiope bruennichi]
MGRSEAGLGGYDRVRKFGSFVKSVFFARSLTWEEREKKPSRRKGPATTTTTTATTRGAHAPARRTVSAGSALPSEAKAVRSPSSKSVSSEPGASTSKDFKIETVLEEEEKPEGGDEKEEKEEEQKDEKDKEEVEDKDKDKEKEKEEDNSSASPDKSHVKFQEPENEDEELEDTK